MGSKTFEVLKSLCVFFISVLFTNCSNKFYHLQSVNKLSVYKMQIDGKSFFNAYQSSDYLLFTFDTTAADYTIRCNELRGNSIDELALKKVDSPYEVSLKNPADKFYLKSSKVSTKNIAKFINRLSVKNGSTFYSATASQYNITIEVNNKVAGSGKNKYAAIIISAANTSKTTGGATLNTNPCPPCKNNSKIYNPN